VEVVFGFLETWLGQLSIAAGSVLFLVIAKGLTRETDESFFKLDDLAIGLDLLVLSMVTAVSAAVTQNVAKKAALDAGDTDTARRVGERVADLGFLAFGAALVMFFVAWMIHRAGRLTKKQREAWRDKQLAKRRRKDPSFDEEDLPDTPDFHPLWGIIIPGVIGLLMLMVSIGTVVG